jgi:S-adenosylmethionine decarboxylase proenzyme
MLDDLEWVTGTLSEAARAASATIVETVFHRFSPWGISGVVVIAESHIAVHIWPERRFVAIEVFTCGDTALMQRATGYLTAAFRSERPVWRIFQRGEVG